MFQYNISLISQMSTKTNTNLMNFVPTEVQHFKFHFNFNSTLKCQLNIIINSNNLNVIIAIILNAMVRFAISIRLFAKHVIFRNYFIVL